MGVIEAPKAPGRAKPIEDTIKLRLQRGRVGQLHRIANESNEAFEYWRGNQYWYVNAKGVLTQQFSGPTGIKGPDKASWKSREPHNVLIDIVAHEVSAGTSRVPGYEVVPTKGTPESA